VSELILGSRSNVMNAWASPIPASISSCRRASIRLRWSAMRSVRLW
jgi:hypothetical protein